MENSESQEMRELIRYEMGRVWTELGGVRNAVGNLSEEVAGFRAMLRERERMTQRNQEVSLSVWQRIGILAAIVSGLMATAINLING